MMTTTTDEEQVKPTLKTSSEEFSKQVELRARLTGDYIASVQHVCDENDIDYEAVTRYILPPLMEKLFVEAAGNKLLKNHSSSTGSLFG